MPSCSSLGQPALVLALILFAGNPLQAADSTVAVAHIKLSGNPKEGAPMNDPLLGSLDKTFKGLLKRIRKARTDKEIKGLYLEVNGLGVGWGKLNELTRAIQECRKSGKKVFAYLEEGSAKDYLLAMACDEVCMPESGTLMLVGIRAEITFYKNLLEKLGIKADILRMGEAKTAAEPYTRTKLSPASRKQYEMVIGDYYDKEIVGRIVAGRKAKKLTALKVKELIDHGPYTATKAKEAGLIDHLAYNEDFYRIVRLSYGAKKLTIKKNYGKKKKKKLDFSNPFALLRALTKPTITVSSKPKIAIVYVNGAITTGKSAQSLFGGVTAGSTTIVNAIKQAEKDETVKAIVLRVDSPGGSALASDLIWAAIKRCKKPVIASMSDVAGSGGYYVCMSCEKIYAEPGTLTGSIGVLGGKLALGGLYDKVGLSTDVISRGKNAGILSATQPFTDSERARMKALMEGIYDTFLTKALEGRKNAGKKMTLAQLKKVAGGRVWTGRQAKEIGIVDELGTLDDAIAYARKQAKLPKDKEVELLELPKAKTLFESLLEQAEMKTPGLGLMEKQLLRQLPELREKLRPAGMFLHLRGEPVWVLMPHQVTIR